VATDPPGHAGGTPGTRGKPKGHLQEGHCQVRTGHHLPSKAANSTPDPAQSPATPRGPGPLMGDGAADTGDEAHRVGRNRVGEGAEPVQIATAAGLLRCSSRQPVVFNFKARPGRASYTSPSLSTSFPGESTGGTRPGRSAATLVRDALNMAAWTWRHTEIDGVISTPTVAGSTPLFPTRTVWPTSGGHRLLAPSPLAPLGHYAVPHKPMRWRHSARRFTRLRSKSLQRRSQRTRVNWTRMNRYATHWPPFARVKHPFPSVRFDVRTLGRSQAR
jgi:hypothetical protein